MATLNLPTGGLHALKSDAAKPAASLDRLSSAKNVGDLFFSDSRCHRKRVNAWNQIVAVKSPDHIRAANGNVHANYDDNSNFNLPVTSSSSGYNLGQESVYLNSPRKTKIVCTIGPSTSSREMIWKLAEAGMNVARLNMSHGDHASHQKTIDLVKEYNAQCENKVIAIMLDTKGPEVRSGDVPQPILLKEGQEFNFTIKRGVSTEDTVSVNYDDFINDVEAGDILLVDGGMMSLAVKSKTSDIVKCEVVDGEN
ncbi:hypothetical protein HAX54_014108 [Datura stramonium]|uniref:pyruvate kinase n=1 Tax=Datura stramonium TaxID=4076 RepID=A0ABS8RZ96_DATST|nr:hypothetical protein [Datura stramonium]